MEKLIIKFIVLVLLFTACKSNTKTDSAVITKSSTQKNKIHKNIHIMAKPDSIAIDAASTAIIVVDMENDFCTKGGMLDHVGINISMIQKAIAPMTKVLAAARQTGINIIYLKMGYHEDLSDLGGDESPNRIRQFYVGDTITAPNGSKSRILIRDTWGTDIVPELKPQPDDIVMYKTRFSGFYNTALDSVLTHLGKKYLILIGCTTSICVESTFRDAIFRNYSPVVLEDCTAEPLGYNLQRSNHEASLLIFQNMGWVSTSDEFIKAVKVQPIDNGKKLQ